MLKFCVTKHYGSKISLLLSLISPLFGSNNINNFMVFNQLIFGAFLLLFLHISCRPDESSGKTAAA